MRPLHPPVTRQLLPAATTLSNAIPKPLGMLHRGVVDRPAHLFSCRFTLQIRSLPFERLQRLAERFLIFAPFTPHRPIGHTRRPPRR